MELRGMFGNRPVRVVAVANEWLDIIEISSGDELASISLDKGIKLDGDLLSIGEVSIVVDRTFLSEAQSLLKLASRSQQAFRNPTESSLPVFCTQCGERREPQARFCTSCGGSFTPVSVQANSSSFTSRPFAAAPSEASGGYRYSAGDFEGGMSAGQSTSASARRNLFLGVAAVVIAAVVAFVVVRSNQDGSAGSSVDIRTTAACETLSQYAFVGIPATYVDDGAQLLYALAGEFDALDRRDIASSIEDIVDLTYAGPSGQLSAKNLLVETAATYC